MDPVIKKLDVFPDYSGGFVFMWEILESFNESPPWTFFIEEAASPTGPWISIAGPIVDTFFYKEPWHRLINKSSVLYYRVRMIVGDNVYFSGVVQPYGDLDRKDFLIAREIMRKEVLHMKGMAGTAGRLYTVATFGPRCRKCVDPVTGEVRNSKCKDCFGTGRMHPYFGPYDAWMTFSEDKQHIKQDDGMGTFEHKLFNVRLVANPVVKKNDVIVDLASDKRYYVNQASVVAEIRRIPIVQMLAVSEAPVSDKVYSIT